MKKILAFLILSFLIQSCTEKIFQPTVIDKGCGFNLETITFDENVSKLYSKHIQNENEVEYDSIRDGKMHDSILQYKISNVMTDALKLKIPQKPFGYLYKTPEIDSIAKFQNTYFKTLHTLTNKKKKPIAYYAETTFATSKESKKALAEIVKKYGKPKYEFCLSSEFNQCSYEWVLKDKTIQIETSFGWSSSFSSDGKSSNGKYYRFDFLEIENKSKDQIHKSHIYECPEKILYDGKYISYKDFQMEKITVFKDDFLLNSTNKELINDPNYLYNINRANENE
jgi:hypothetical protein